MEEAELFGVFIAPFFSVSILIGLRARFWNGLGVVLGWSWGHLGVVLGSSWGGLGGSSGHLGVVLGDLGVVLGDLGNPHASNSLVFSF